VPARAHVRAADHPARVRAAAPAVAHVQVPATVRPGATVVRGAAGKVPGARVEMVTNGRGHVRVRVLPPEGGALTGSRSGLNGIVPSTTRARHAAVRPLAPTAT